VFTWIVASPETFFTRATISRKPQRTALLRKQAEDFMGRVTGIEVQKKLLSGMGKRKFARKVILIRTKEQSKSVFTGLLPLVKIPEASDRSGSATSSRPCSQLALPTTPLRLRRTRLRKLDTEGREDRSKSLSLVEGLGPLSNPNGGPKPVLPTKAHAIGSSQAGT